MVRANNQYKFEANLDGFTSDHTYVTAIISTYGVDGVEIILTGLTWNLLNQCEPHNNPFGVKESAENYVLRKIKQLEFLTEQMKSGKFDFIVLQEVDIFTQSPMPEFVKNFLTEVRAYGWLNTHTEATDNVRMPLLTFYNTKKLAFVIKKPVLPVPETKKNCGLEATFNYVGSQTAVCITNIHLDYTIDFRETILIYQKLLIAAGKFMIIAGDTNNPVDKESYSLIGDRVKRPTNIDPQFKLRLLDGFMAGPADPGQRVVIIEGPLVASFEWLPENLLSKLIKRPDDSEGPKGKFIYNTQELGPNERLPHGYHISLPGEPWILPGLRHLLALFSLKTTPHSHENP